MHELIATEIAEILPVLLPPQLEQWNHLHTPNTFRRRVDCQLPIFFEILMVSNHGTAWLWNLHSFGVTKI